MMIPRATNIEWKMKNWYDSGLTKALSTGTLVVKIEGISNAAIAPRRAVEYMNESSDSLFFSSSLVFAIKIMIICSEQKCSGR